MRHFVPLRDNRNGLTEQRSGKPLASKYHHITPKGMRINRKSQACLPAYTTKGRRAPKVFRPQKSSITGVRLRSVLGVLRMAHERDRRFLWLKSDGSSPTLTETRTHNPTIHAFRDRVLPKLH